MKNGQNPAKSNALRYAILFTLIGLVGVETPHAIADDGSIVVITSILTPSKTLTREQVADIFLGRIPPGERWKPIDNNEESLRQQFYQSTANLSSNRARAVWSSLVFANRAIPPREMSSEQATLVVAKEPFSITYVFNRRVPKDVKVLLSLPAP